MRVGDIVWLIWDAGPVDRVKVLDIDNHEPSILACYTQGDEDMDWYMQWRTCPPTYLFIGEI